MNSRSATLVTAVLVGFASLLAFPQQSSENNAKSEEITRMSRVLELRDRVAKARNSSEMATAFFALNRELDAYASFLNAVMRKHPELKEKTSQWASNTAYSMIPVTYCDPDGRWYAQPTGYIVYAQVLPTGKDADLAWLRNLGLDDEHSCGDYEGSHEEAEDGVGSCREFLSRFPNSSFAPLVRKKLDAFDADLKGSH
jgi:hypothetical protein